MSTKTDMVDDPIVRRKAASSALTDEEIYRLMQAYTGQERDH